MTTKLDVRDVERLAELLASIRPDEEILLESDGVAIGRVLPVEKPRLTPDGKRAIKLGRFIGQGSVSDDFDAPLPEEELDHWYNTPRGIS